MQFSVAFFPSDMPNLALYLMPPPIDPILVAFLSFWFSSITHRSVMMNTGGIASMMRLAAKVSKPLRNSKKAMSLSLLKPPPLKVAALPPIRHFSAESNIFSANPVALEMIAHASSVAREQKTEDSYARGIMILEQCKSTQPDDSSKALVELACSTLLFERGFHEEAIERLRKLQELSLSSIAVKVAASEALVGIYLEHYQEETASVVIDITLKLMGTIRLETSNEIGFNALEARLMALKGLIELIRGNPDTAQSLFDGVVGHSWFIGNAALSCGELFHSVRKFSMAKELYQKVIEKMSEMKELSDPVNIGACNMIPAEVVTAATCALGQLEAHMGNFVDAEALLTKAMIQTEERLGPRHPKVGVILTCIALMYRNRATVERSSSLLIQEGLYRKAIELLKAPLLDVDGAEEKVYGKDIIALARGGYAETLGVQQSRKAEGERLKHWAETAWRSVRISLGEAMEWSESPNKMAVIDTRICRVV